MRRLVMFTLLVLASAAAAQETAKPNHKELIVGKWLVELPKDAPKEAAELTLTVEFKKDGGLVMSMGTIKMDGKYKFLKDDEMEVEMEFLGKKDSKKMKVEIKGEEMTTTEMEGKKEATKFKKVK